MKLLFTVILPISMNEHHKGGDVGIDISITWCKSGKWIVRENKYCNKKVCKLDLQKFN